jgi:DNA-binding NarL/FixJ family response regulator
MKNKDIARELGISVSAVEKHMVKALTHIATRVPR